MGGYGSGNHRSKKATVEDCRRLDVKDLLRFGVLKDPADSWSGLSWKNGAGETTGSISYRVKIGDGEAWFQLLYRLRGTTDVDYRVGLTTTPLHYGGVRWWFECPAVGCGRRVRKLYLAPGGQYFACRHCNRLTYESSQTHDPRMSFYLNHPSEALAALDDALAGKHLSRALVAGRAVWGRRRTA